MCHSRMLRYIIPAVILALCAQMAEATTVQDLVRIKGHETNTLIGMGLVVGLDGTGDTSKGSRVAARPFAAYLRNLGNPVGSLDELSEADSFAIVQVTLTVPATGAREGDRYDVDVHTLFNASSLAGGRLVVSLLRPPRPDAPDLPALAMAEGSLLVNPTNLRGAVVRGGGQMLGDIRTNPVTPSGKMTLVIKDHYAGYPAASALSDAINEEFFLDGHAEIAVVSDAKNIHISLPHAERDRPASFIASLLTIPIDSSLIQTEARIVVNEERGIIAIRGSVSIDPVAITVDGLSINAVGNAPGAGGQWAGLDTTDGTGRSSTQLAELLKAFDQLQVPVRDQIAVIYELERTGALHARIVSE